MLFAAEQEISKSAYFWMLGIAIALLVLAVAATFFFINFKNAKKMEKDTFKTVTGKFKIFRFWQYYAIIILMLVGYVGTLILLPISIEGLIKAA
ncbi:hypothetical protein [Spiroplasma culicicola]|uniref:Transmembrane protein n=1 Tax=Spiroplasma culicicola AES-1 TaxID=1276246 RepID=W6A6H0_9MOLU|nr:hypothetical protein [Spiroplasma culicicola]AHI52597.1 hypothetical protein SCULI_v1c02560 [Spiroplasma culicicola AES-1]